MRGVESREGDCLRSAEAVSGAFCATAGAPRDTHVRERMGALPPLLSCGGGGPHLPLANGESEPFRTCRLSSHESGY